MLYRKHKIPLDNGLTLIWEHRPSYQSVAITCVVAAGSRHDFPGKMGLAHFVEHSILQSELEELRSIIDAGGLIGAETGIDATVFRVYSHRDDALEALRCLSRLLLRVPENPAFLEKEKAVIREELNIFGQDDPGDLQRVKFSLLGASEDLQHVVGGSLRTLRRFTVDDIQRFHGQFYVASNMVLSVVGNLDIQKHREELESLFQELPGGKKSEHEDWNIASGPKTRFCRLAPQCGTFLFFNCSDHYREDLGAIELIGEIFTQGPRSRLMSRLRERDALVYGIDSQMHLSRDFCTMDLFTMAEPRNISRVFGAILDEASLFCREAPHGSELESLKEQFIKHRVLEFEGPGFASDWYAFREILSPAANAPGNLMEWADEIRRLTPEDISLKARSIFRQANLFAFVVGPVNFLMRRRIRGAVRNFRNQVESFS